MRQICRELDPELVDHLQVVLGIEFVQFAFRWINCLLVRELRMELIIRAWDTYLCEHAHLMLTNSSPLESAKEEGGGVGEGASHSSFSTFHTFVCVALLMKFAPDVKEIDDFSDAMLFLQKLPTETWEVRDVELLLSEAYLYQAWYMKNRGFGRK
jgi:TBC1 domain family member 2